MVGALAYLPNDFDEVIAAMADGRYDTSGWTETIDLDGVEEAIYDLREGRRMKVLASA